MTRVVIFASAPAAAAAGPLRLLLEEHRAAGPIVYLRDRDRRELGAVLDGVDVRSDKPAGGRMRFVRSLRAEPVDLAIALWLGHDEYWPAKALFWLCRAREKHALDERSKTPTRVSGLFGALRHMVWRRKHRVPSPYGRGGLLRALVRFCYRATLGRVLGAALTMVRFVVRC